MGKKLIFNQKKKSTDEEKKVAKYKEQKIPNRRRINILMNHQSEKERRVREEKREMRIGRERKGKDKCWSEFMDW